ncbi:unnamed protein product [Arabidopsis thaliana]|uniref:(thale cress) hypothetical protein n=1 Tax=Arabidopsis thaliana TaxID=3702 RepID=A0A7G2E5E4_ARATH|nr:unnamed protein product [Arabidopsis thaliana]
MASSSSSSSTRFWKYDVFLSFRGKDTRKNIVSHLYWALHNNGILTFKDDQRIELGDSISDELIKAIHTSRFAIVVISENYAASRWCLEELREIMEFQAVEGGTNVVPIFYGVNPCDVRRQERSFATAFASMGRPETDDKVLKWREALTNIADLSGFVSSTCVDEATMVEKVVRNISDRLLTESNTDNMEDIVGMSSHIESLGSLLNMESKEEVRFVGISGMGGVGKTTIAHYLYGRTLLDDGESRIKVLEEQSLVDISAEGSLTMHALVEQTGREIVLEESNHVAQEQRILWDSENVYNVLRDNTGTRSIEGLVLNMCEMPEVLHIGGSRFRQMPNVKFLKFYTHLANRPSNLKLLRDTTSLPRMLRLLHWDAYPLTLLPSEFCPHSLVELTLRYSNLQILCSRNLNLRKLKRLDVSRSKDMKELPNLSMAVQLKELVVEGCEKLKFLVELPRSLNYLNAHGCSSLQTVSLPSRHSINHLDLSGCSQLNQVQQLITQFLTGGQHEELEASLRFACIPQIVMPNYFDNQSPGATIQLSPNIMDFAACVIVACRRPFHLQFSKTSYSGKWDEGGGVFQINLKPELHRSLEMEGEEAINSYLVLIQVLGSVNNDQAGNFISTLQLPLTVEPPPAEIIACGVRMNLM